MSGWTVTRGEPATHLMIAARVGPAVCGAGRRTFVARTSAEARVTCARCLRVVSASKAAATALPPLGGGR